MTHKEFAIKDKEFRKACKLAGIAPTTRQAGKYRSCKGLAYQFKNTPTKMWFKKQVLANLKLKEVG